MKKKRNRQRGFFFEPTDDVRQQLAEIEEYAKSINPNISRTAVLAEMVKDLHRKLCAAHRLPLPMSQQVSGSAMTAGKNGNGNSTIEP